MNAILAIFFIGFRFHREIPYCVESSGDFLLLRNLHPAVRNALLHLAFFEVVIVKTN